MSGYWDIHNHILPGIDDGAADIQESMKMIAEERRQGVRNIIFTPHYREGMFTVPADERERAYQDLVQRAAEQYPNMNFYLGCELHVSRNLADHMKDIRCRMASTDFVLLEFSSQAGYGTLISYVSEAMKEGCTPIIAHAERCIVLTEDPQRAIRLRDSGALIQINADTFLEGLFSKRKKFAKTLIEAGAVDFIGSDAHGTGYRPVRIEECAKVLEKKYGTKTVKRLLIKNPEAAFAAEAGIQ